MITESCKKCRRLGQKLFLKGERCFGQKCAMVRRPYAPGIHGKSFRKKVSEYGQQLAEKQKIRYSYNLSEKQLKKYFTRVVDQQGDKEELFVKELESRLDNVVYRLGWAPSRKMARQVVNHRHILVNNRRADIPSFQVKKGDVVKIKQKSRQKPIFQDIQNNLKNHKPPRWLSLEKDKYEAKVNDNLQLDDVERISEISKIIEFYSR